MTVTAANSESTGLSHATGSTAGQTNNADRSAGSPFEGYIVGDDFSVHDIRFPTSLSGDGTDAMNKECDYSAAYIVLRAAPRSSATATVASDGVQSLVGYGMTFTIGRGNDLVCAAVRSIARLIVGKEVEELFADMGKTWDMLVADPQLRWLGPEKGIIHIATAAVINAVWDMFARARGKPLWRLVTEMTPEEIVRCVSFRYITDAITPAEALDILRKSEKERAARTEYVLKHGFPAYTTSVGWVGYDDAKVARLTQEALDQGFNHFKVKVGASLEDDKRRLGLVRSIIDDGKNFKEGRKIPSKESLEGKNANENHCVLMVDANQVWDVDQAVEYMTQLNEFKPWFIEEPTAPDDALGHANIRARLKPLGIKVATGEHAHNRMLFKQLLQAQALDVVQIDSCRLAGVNEILAVLLMAKKFGVPVCPHAGGVGLCEYVIHLSLIDYIAVSGSIEQNVLEFVDHLHEHFRYPVSINDGRYNIPDDPRGGYSIEMFQESIEDYSFPDGAYWKSGQARIACK